MGKALIRAVMGVSPGLQKITESSIVRFNAPRLGRGDRGFESRFSDNTFFEQQVVCVVFFLILVFSCDIIRIWRIKWIILFLYMMVEN